MDRVHAGDIIAGSFEFVRDRWKSVIAWSAIYMVVAIVVPRAIFSRMLPQFGFEQVRTGAIDPGQFFLVFLVIFLVAILLMTTIQAAVFRAALHPARRELTYLRLGGDELRLFSLMVVLGVLFFIGIIIAEILFIAILAAFFAIGGAIRILGILLAVVGGLGLFAAMIFLVVRLASAGPLTILRKRITIGEAWRLTRGHFWTLFGSYAVVAVVSFVVVMVMFMVQLSMGSGLQQTVLQQMMHPRDPLYQQQVAAIQMQQYASFGLGEIISAAIGSVVYGFLIALQFGSIAVATRLLLDVEEPASVF